MPLCCLFKSKLHLFFDLGVVSEDSPLTYTAAEQTACFDIWVHQMGPWRRCQPSSPSSCLTHT